MRLLGMIGLIFPILVTLAAPRGACSTTVCGAVVDSLTQAPVAYAVVGLENGRAADLTDAAGRFVLPAVQAGRQRLIIHHVAYEEGRLAITLRPEQDTAEVVIRLRPRYHKLDESKVTVDYAVPLTADDRARFSLSGSLLQDMAVTGVPEMVRNLPSVVLLGDRPFFRAIGFEHVLPLLDGVPAREPLRGEWVTPPPDAILMAAYTPGYFEAEYGQALAGTFAIDLPDGGPQHHLRINASSDRTAGGLQDYQGTDDLQVTATGPAGPLAYAASLQVEMDDTPLRYDRARPRHEMFGISLGPRMSSAQCGLARLTWNSPGGSCRAALTVLARSSRDKTYLHNYSATGWVGFAPEYDRYTTFIVDPAAADSAVYYSAPSGVPVLARDSRLIQGTVTMRPSARWRASLSLRLAQHEYASRLPGVSFASESAARDWLIHARTWTSHQEEAFYATHGCYPEYEDDLSREGAIAFSARGFAGAHELSAGAGFTRGRHRMFMLLPIGWLGSLHDWMDTSDAFAYLQDVWWSDKYSAMTLALRWDGQWIRNYPTSASGSTLSPRIGFRQPLGTADALHAWMGLLYQFPPLIERLMTTQLSAQRSRAFDIGLQHHHSRNLVGYVGFYAREYSDVIFSERRPADEEIIAPSQSETQPLYAIDAYGVEVVIDHRVTPWLSGQLRAEAAHQEREGAPLPWGRSASLAGWLRARVREPLHIGLAFRWDSGRPYEICLEPKGCAKESLFRGRLPNTFDVDVFGSWAPVRGWSKLRLTAEIRNVIGRQAPRFDFGIYSSKVGVGNFIAYYDRYGRADGYLIEIDDEWQPVHLENPQALTPGRNIRLGVELEL